MVDKDRDPDWLKLLEGVEEVAEDAEKLRAVVVIDGAGDKCCATRAILEEGRLSSPMRGITGDTLGRVAVGNLKRGASLAVALSAVPPCVGSTKL
jgi:hypothetical protein